MGERSVSREDRKQHPSAFRATDSQWLISTWSELNQGQCALFDFIESAIVLQRGTVWTTRSCSLIVFLCDIPWFFFPSTTKKRQIWDEDVGNGLGGRPKWGGALWEESGRSTDLSTDGAVCNSSCKIKKKQKNSSAATEAHVYPLLGSKCKDCLENIFLQLHSKNS